MFSNSQSQLVSQATPQIGNGMLAVFLFGQGAEKLHASPHPIVSGQGTQQLQQSPHAVDRLFQPNQLHTQGDRNTLHACLRIGFLDLALTLVQQHIQVVAQIVQWLHVAKLFMGLPNHVA